MQTDLFGNMPELLNIHFAFPESFRNTFEYIVEMSFETPLKERIQRSANITLQRKNMKMIIKK